MASLRPEVLGINCVPARGLLADLRVLAEAAPAAPLVAYGNLAAADRSRGGVFDEPVAPAEYAELARTWLAIGARIVGGCCGTTAAHTAALRALADDTVRR